MFKSRQGLWNGIIEDYLICICQLHYVNNYRHYLIENMVLLLEDVPMNISYQF